MPPRPDGTDRRQSSTVVCAPASSPRTNATRPLRELSFTTDFAEFADRQLVVEAVIEDEALKTEIFRELDQRVTDPDAILASNTSSIPIMKLGIATQRPEQVIGIHFFNPVPVLRLVELVTVLLTSPRHVAARTGVRHRRAAQAGHPQPGPRRVRRQRAAHPVPPVGDPHDGVGVRHRGRHRHRHGGGLQPSDGPLRLADLIGLDTTLAVAESLYDEFKEPLYASPPLLSRMVEAGLLGRKTGRGLLRLPRGRR